MKTTMGRMSVVLVALAIGAGGCGTDEAGLGEDGTGGAQTAGAGGTVGAGGQGGSAQAGTGGGAAVGTGGTFAPTTGAAPYDVAISTEIGYQFTRADHDMCMAWPKCPSDIVAPLPDSGRVFSNQCTMAFDGTRLSCAACLRLSNADFFVGRCVAPFIMFGNGNFVTSALSPSDRRKAADPAAPILPGGWALCTGDRGSYTDRDGVPVTETFDATVRAGVNANTVCKD